MNLQYIIETLASFLAVAFVLSFHEFAHAFAAVKNGDLTPKLYNRYTLNPLAHFDIVGLLMFTFAGFGWAKPVPINPNNFHNYKKGLFLTSIAGVIMNYILAFVSFPLYKLCLKYLPDIMLFDDVITYFFYFCFAYNLSFFVFNLLPFYPLDGFRVVDCLARSNNKVVNFLRNYGYYILLGLIVLGFIFRTLNLHQLDFLNIFLNFATDFIGWPIKEFWGLIF